MATVVVALIIAGLLLFCDKLELGGWTGLSLIGLICQICEEAMLEWILGGGLLLPFI